jgi:4'-phosphopantetheinyl transferase
VSRGGAAAGLALPPLQECAIAGVRLAWVDLDDPARSELSLAAVMSDVERARARRFRFERDRLRFMAARAVLRGLVGRELGLTPDAVPLAADAYGKPYLRSAARAPLSFNLSHTAGRALYGLSPHAELGVDVEALKPIDGMAELARDVFAADELAAWEALPAASRVHGFYAGWTRKEAFVKALGRGLDYPLDAFSVSLAPDSEARLLRLPADAGPPEDWSITALEPEVGYLAAVVAHAAR